MQHLRPNLLLSRSFSALRTLQSNSTRAFAEDAQQREASLNKVTLLGRVGGAPSIFNSEGKHEAINFPLATNSYYDNSQTTTWHRIVIFKPSLVGVAKKIVNKGDRLMVKGYIRYSEYKDKDGIEQKSTSIVANQVIVMSKNYKAMESADSAEEVSFR